MYTPNSLSSTPASYGRRLGALLYDSLAGLAVLMLISALWLPIYGGEAVPTGNALYQASLLGGLSLYFAYCWHKGQTLGMRAWRLHIADQSGQPVTYRQALLRCVIAPLNLFSAGLAYHWVDRWTHTQIFQVKKCQKEM